MKDRGEVAQRLDCLRHGGTRLPEQPRCALEFTAMHGTDAVRGVANRGAAERERTLSRVVGGLQFVEDRCDGRVNLLAERRVFDGATGHGD